MKNITQLGRTKPVISTIKGCHNLKYYMNALELINSEHEVVISSGCEVNIQRIKWNSLFTAMISQRLISLIPDYDLAVYHIHTAHGVIKYND